MRELIKNIQRERTRAVILETLIALELDWVRVSDLYDHIVRLQSRDVDEDEFTFHLNYLESKGYIETQQLRAGRAGIELRRVRATAKAADLKDGRIAADSGVAFG